MDISPREKKVNEVIRDPGPFRTQNNVEKKLLCHVRISMYHT